ncbi:hypothetical protein A0H81_07656 [Grifola frondosa]|uniref:Uncharacterized protein n=1 Tax=Grifola frondosa TaxID=5627 RepID=A0A1C7M5B3_GRIFR|nr:hypothetical protein A0H81_07656 [Grifola frondosa]
MLDMTTIIPSTTRSALKRVALARAPAAAFSPRFYSSTMHDNDPTQNPAQNLPPIEDAPGWNQYLASASEANVKADRANVSLADLQASTVKHVKERHHSEASNEPGVDTEHMDNGNTIESQEAVYERDEISGPLAGAGSTSGGEFTETFESEVIKKKVK